jgi:hypothetical protein
VIYALSALCIILAAALWRVVRLQRATSARLSVCRALRTHDRAQRRDAERRAVEAHRQWLDVMARAEAAEHRLDVARDTLRTAAEAAAADLAARPGPVRCGVRAPAVEPITQPAPEDSGAFAAAFYEPLLEAQRVPVFAASQAREAGEPSHAFVVRWGDA